MPDHRTALNGTGTADVPHARRELSVLLPGVVCAPEVCGYEIAVCGEDDTALVAICGHPSTGDMRMLGSYGRGGQKLREVELPVDTEDGSTLWLRSQEDSTYG